MVETGKVMVRVAGTKSAVAVGEIYNVESYMIT